VNLLLLRLHPINPKLDLITCEFQNSIHKKKEKPPSLSWCKWFIAWFLAWVGFPLLHAYEKINTWFVMPFVYLYKHLSISYQPF